MPQAQNPLTPEPVVMDRTSPITNNLATPTRALAIGAHPDDIDFGCGATLAKWAAQGCHIDLVVCTDGSKGSWNPSNSTEELLTTRQQEQRQAAQLLGATGRVFFLGAVDGELSNNRPLRGELTKIIRESMPEVILGHDPWKRYRMHPDHRNAGWLMTDSVVAARDHLFFPELALQPHRPNILLLWEADQPDHYEDVTGYVDVKYQALLAHRSQHRSTMNVSADSKSFRPAVEAKLAAAGKAVGCQHAEVFKSVDDL